MILVCKNSGSSIVSSLFYFHLWWDHRSLLSAVGPTKPSDLSFPSSPLTHYHRNPNKIPNWQSTGFVKLQIYCGPTPDFGSPVNHQPRGFCLKLQFWLCLKGFISIFHFRQFLRLSFIKTVYLDGFSLDYPQIWGRRVQLTCRGNPDVWLKNWGISNVSGPFSQLSEPDDLNLFLCVTRFCSMFYCKLFSLLVHIFGMLLALLATLLFGLSLISSNFNFYGFGSR